MAGYKAPPDRRCTARRRRTKEPCQNWAMVGSNVCRLHGAKGADRVAELVDDPRLLDLARTIATSQWILEEHLPALSDEALLELWRRRNPVPPGVDPKDHQPSAGELLELKTALVASSITALAKHGSMQVAARRTLATEQLVASLVQPILVRLGQELMEVVARVVTPAQLEEIRRGISLKQKRALIEVKEVIDAG
jgi:hypothetical protein